MRHLPRTICFVSLLTTTLIGGCKPSESDIATQVANVLAATQAIQGAVNTAIAQTQAAVPTGTATPTPAPTSTPVPTLPALVVSWEFNNEGDSGGWGANPWDTVSLGQVTIHNGFLMTESLANNPMIYVRSLRLDADQISQIELRMLVSDGRTGKFYFATEKEPEMNEAKSFAFVIQPGSDFVTYRIDTRMNSLWRSVVTELRLDPTHSPAKIEIDHIRLLTSN